MPRRKLRQGSAQPWDTQAAPHELLGGHFCERGGGRRPEVDSVKAGFQVEEGAQGVLALAPVYWG